jgi:hypothetical protein
MGRCPTAGILRSCAEAAIADAEANIARADAGLKPLMYITVMECEGALAVDIQRVTSRKLAFDALNLNTRAYGMPDSVTNDVLDAGVYFSDLDREFGFVVYTRDGVP